MKKLILFIILFMGIMPLMHKGKFTLINSTSVYAQSYSEEDDCDPTDPASECYCDPNDPNGPCFVCSDTGDDYEETITGSDNCFTYVDWTEHYWDCETDETTTGSFTNGLTTLTAASVSLSSNSGNVGDAVTVTAGSTTTGNPPITYNYEEYDDDTEDWSTIASTTDESIVYILDVPGEVKFRVTAVSGCGGTVISSESIYTAIDNGPCGITGPPKLILSSTTGNLNDEVLLTAIAKKSGTPSSLTYNFQVLDNGNWNDQGTSTDSTYSYTIDEADTKFRVVTTAVCNGVTTTDYSLTKEFIVMSPDVTLTEDETAGKPGDEVTLTANVANATSLTNLQYTFQVYYKNNWYDFDSQGGSTLTYDTKILGSLKFRVQITYDGAPFTPVVSNTVDYSAAFCADDFKTHYATDMNTAWTTAQTNANSQHGTLFESGFMGTYDGSSYGAPTTPLVTNPCGTVYDVTSGSVSWPTGANPVTGEMNLPFILGQFHTHPPVRWCTSSVSYAQGPSCVDLGTCAPPGGTAVNPATFPFPMVVRTYVGTVTGGSATPVNAATIDTAYGNSCTNY